MLLQGQKVRLKPIETEEDQKSFFRSRNSPEAMGEFVNFEPMHWESFQAFAKEWEKPPLDFDAFLIEKNEDKKIIGCVVHYCPSIDFKGVPEIGYIINEPSDRGKGYASEAAKLLVDYLFLTKMIVRIQAGTSLRNSSSMRVLEKLGFQKEGVLRKSYFVNGKYDDSVIFGLLREEWEAKRK